MRATAESRLEGANFGIYGNRNQKIGSFKAYRMPDLLEGQSLLEGFGVFCQDKKCGIVFIVFFGRMRMMKMVIQFLVGKMPVDKMNISFQSRGMVTSRMLMVPHLVRVTMCGSGMIMGWKEDELECPKANQNKHQAIVSFEKCNH